MAASMDTLLERASALSQRNTSRAGDLFKKLTQDVARLTEENAQLQVQVTKLTELCERREQDLAATRSELRVKTQLAAREREQADRTLADAKKEAELANNTLRVLRADPVLDARIANAARIAGDPAAIARAEREGADARARQAAIAAASAPSFSVHGAAKDVIAQIAGVPVPQPGNPSGAGVGAGAVAGVAPISPAGLAAVGSLEVGDSGVASAAVERVRAILLSDPAVAAVLDERRVREAALEAAGIGAAAAAKQAREAAEEAAAALAAVDRVRIASLEKKLATAREAAEAARADLELEKKAVTQLTAERVDRAALEATVDRLRGQLLSLLQQQEAINMYFALMDGTPDAGAGITLVGLEDPAASASSASSSAGAASSSGAGVGATASQRAAAKAAYDALDGSGGAAGSGGSAVGAGNMASYVAAMREAQQRAAQTVLAEMAAADAAVAAQSESVVGAVVARGQEAKRRAQAKLEGRKPASGGGSGIGPAGAAEAHGEDDDGDDGHVSDPERAAEEKAAAASRRRAELADAARAPDDQDKALAAFQAPLMGLRSVGGGLMPTAALDAMFSLLADSDSDDNGGKSKRSRSKGAGAKGAGAVVDSVAAASAAGPSRVSADIDGIERDEEEAEAQEAAEAAVRALAKEDPLQASAEAEKADAEALRRAVAAEGWLAPLADRTRFVPHGSGRPGQPAYVPIAMLSRRIFVLLWRNARKTAQRTAAAAREAALKAGAPAPPPCTVGADMTLRLGDLSEGAPEEMQRIPGLWEQLTRSAKRIAETTAAPASSSSSSSSSSGAGATASPSEAWLWVPLGEANWEWAVSKALPGVHRGVLLLRLAERLRCELGDLIIRLPEYAAPEVLLGNDEADAVQERLFVLLAARVWGVTPSAASAAIRASLTGGQSGASSAASSAASVAEEEDEADKAAAARDAATAAAAGAGSEEAKAEREQAMRGGYITLHDIFVKAFPVWSILGAHPEFAPLALRSKCGVDLDPASGGSTRVTLAVWHEFFVRLARTNSLPELVHLLRALRYLLVAASGKHRRDWWARKPILTPLLLQSLSEEERESKRIKPKDGSASAATDEPSFGSKVAGAIDGSGDCIIM